MTQTKSIQAVERTQHTPGPWRNEAGLILSPDGRGVTRMPGSVFTAKSGMIGSEEDNRDGQLPGGFVVSDAQINEGNANARLIAAAPELLEACKKAENGLIQLGAALAEVHDYGTYRDAEAGLIAVQAAIAKAEGK